MIWVSGPAMGSVAKGLAPKERRVGSAGGAAQEWRYFVGFVKFKNLDLDPNLKLENLDLDPVGPN